MINGDTIVTGAINTSTGVGRAGGTASVGPLGVFAEADLLFDGDQFLEFTAPRISTGNDHGGGDTLAAAIACALANGYSVPEAVIKLKQGFGRLIRSKTDTGIVAILDGRVITKRYGRIFLDALPNCRRVVVAKSAQT